ncbi:MAG: GAF domain-containing protein, partial [Verrucomicrobiota bacterium]
MSANSSDKVNKSPTCGLSETEACVAEFYRSLLIEAFDAAAKTLASSLASDLVSESIAVYRISEGNEGGFERLVVHESKTRPDVLTESLVEHLPKISFTIEDSPIEARDISTATDVNIFKEGQKPVEYKAITQIRVADRKSREVARIYAFREEANSPHLTDEGILTRESPQLRAVLVAAELVQELVFALFQSTIRTEIRDNPTLSRTLDSIIQRAVCLTAADRGDIALWSRMKDELVFVGQTKNGVSLKAGDNVPDWVFMRKKWDRGPEDVSASRNIQTSLERNLSTINHDSRSQIAVNLIVKKKAIGVLNLESNREDAFDAEDERRLEPFACSATMAIEAHGRRAHPFEPPDKPTARQSQITSEFLGIALRCVVDQYNVAGGLIFIADNSKETLQCRAYHASPLLDVDYKSFSYPFGGETLASRAFRKKNPEFSTNPTEDTSCDREGAKMFEISGATLATPLLYGDEVLGVLVIWSNTSYGLSPDEGQFIAPFTRLAAAYVARPVPQNAPLKINDLENSIDRAQPHIKNAPLDDKILRLIFVGILAGGFERARIWIYEPIEDSSSRQFRCLATFGLDNAKLEGAKQGLDNRPYSQHIAETFRSNPRARSYDPGDPTMFGEDADALKYGKDPGQQWAVVPITMGGELFGQISVDQHVSRNRITRTSLECLTLTGALVSQELTNQKERRIIDAETFHSAFIEGVPVAIWRKDRDGRFTYVNDTLAKYANKDPSEMIGKKDFDFFPDELSQNYKDNDQHVIDSAARFEA